MKRKDEIKCELLDCLVDLQGEALSLQDMLDVVNDLVKDYEDVCNYPEKVRQAINSINHAIIFLNKADRK